jgi:hypothetical protein
VIRTTGRLIEKPALACGALLICLLAGFASAQESHKPDPIIGTWKLNPAGTRVSPGMAFPAPSQRTEVYRQTESGQIALAVATPSQNGSATTSNLMFSARGGLVTQENAPPGQVLIETRVAPGEWRVTYLANGVQFLTMKKAVSPDGKTMTQTVTGETLQGARFEGVLVFDRQ